MLSTHQHEYCSCEHIVSGRALRNFRLQPLQTFLQNHLYVTLKRWSPGTMGRNQSISAGQRNTSWNADIGNIPRKHWQDHFCKVTAKNVFMTKENHGKPNTVKNWFPHLFISSPPWSPYSDSAFPRWQAGYTFIQWWAIWQLWNSQQCSTVI